MKKCQAFIFFCIFLLTFIVVYIPFCFSIEMDEANIIVNQAELKMKLAFAEVSKADDVGADTSGLIVQLEAGSLFLSEAKLALRADDYDAANSFALECINAAENLIIDADRLIVIAERIQHDILLFTVIGSSIGLVLLIVFGLIFWRVLKKRYFRKVLDMKPDVEEYQ